MPQRKDAPEKFFEDISSIGSRRKHQVGPQVMFYSHHKRSC